MQSSDNNTIKGISLGVLASLIWGSWPVFSKVASLQHLSPVDIVTLRFIVSGVLLLPILIYQAVKLKYLFSKGLLLAIGAGAPYAYLATTGITYSSSAHFGAIGPSTMLVFSTLGSIFLFKEKISLARGLGISLILAGVVLIASRSFSDGSEINHAVLMGDFMFVGCGALWASFTLFSKYWKIPSWVATAMVSVVSGIACIPFTAQVVQEVPIELILQHGFYQGVLAAIVALYCYAKSVSYLGASRGAIFAAFVPPVALILGVIILGETINLTESVGLTAVCVGMLFALGLIRMPIIKSRAV
ncbi:DMT family transporter [Marinomonas mediterranea]|uniref:EamA domain-containing protein n=1 Tax=Marinomonas mediterranea (strain ATCC 700492 / JCM 21426 / NBRC 103028 / MMB-1) TaxID=717774 RepID=F2JYN3_MARM1|nr:EamA family transporter [Marinomonas mediterranea]ADZ89658.1 protein of unknown function DUF6 transmembrane [Marinomonas mediterranea MMB-1]WCN07750.1 EamA family transporter [Marinomonas mediterranea]WCN11850.1 EamA family transporter [Marinomonas mediterranea]WCN15895.1 EamA family transporter [Marinomonas mediterranea MMB-1]